MEGGEVFPSLTVDMNSATPYTDATQVSVRCKLYLDFKCEYIIQLKNYKTKFSHDCYINIFCVHLNDLGNNR